MKNFTEEGMSKRKKIHSLSASTSKKKPLSFYKIMLSPTLQSKKLCIPKAFAMAFSDELSGSVILTVPTGESWEVSLVNEDDQIWLGRGWQDFVEYFSIGFAYFLLFLYKGNSDFDVHIFSPTGCQIPYSNNGLNIPQLQEQPFHSSQRSEQEKQDFDRFDVSFRGSSKSKDSDIEVITLDIEDEPSSLRGNDEPMNENDNVSGKLIPDEGGMHGSRENDANQGTQSAYNHSVNSPGLMESLASSGISMPKNPFFVRLIKKYNLANGHFVRISVRFVREHLSFWKTGDIVKLEASNGKQWPVRCVRQRSGFILGSGWIVFARENRLKVGNLCVFELPDSNDRVLKVHVSKNSQLTAPE